MKIVTLYAWHNGDTSVGIPGERAEIKLNVGGFDALDEAEYVERASEAIKTAFRGLWGFPALVATGDQIKAGEAPANALDEQAVVLRIYQAQSGQWSGKFLRGTDELGGIAGCASAAEVEQAAAESIFSPDRVEIHKRFNP